MSFLSGIGDLFGGNNAGDQAMGYYNQIPDILKQYLKEVKKENPKNKILKTKQE